MRTHAVDPDAVRRLCDERGMSLRLLSARSGLSYSFVKYVATPDRDCPSHAQRRVSDTSGAMLAKALGAEMSEFTIPVNGPERRPHVAA